MTVSAQISVYPLRQERLTPTIAAVTQALREAGLEPKVGPMSTIVTGDAGSVFRALEAAFARAASTAQVVMTVAVSNACPGP